MRLTLTVKNASAALNAVAGAVGSGTTIPILGCVKLVAKDDALALTTSDLDAQASTRAPAKVTRPGGVCAPFRALADIVRHLDKDADMSLAVEDDKPSLRVVSGRSRFTLPTLPVEDFPDFGDLGETVELMFDAKALAQTLECVAVAVSTEETRYYLNGIYLHAHEDGLRAVATDGHRLIRRDLPSQELSTKTFAAVILPTAAVKDMRRLAAEAAKDETAWLASDGKRVAFTLSQARLVSKVIDGTFPDYTRVIPEHGAIRAEVETAALSRAVTRALIACGKNARSGALDFADARLTLSAHDADGISASDEIDAALDGAPIRIGFNLRYLAELIPALAGERLALRMTDPQGPAVLFDPADATTLGVLMPLRV